MAETTDRIQADIKDAMRQRQRERLDALRMAMSDLKNAGIEKKGRLGLSAEVANPADHLDEAETIQVLQKLLKRRREAAEQFRAGGREDLASNELAEAAVIEHYLPRALDAAALEALVRAAIAETGATTVKDMGAVVKAVMARASGRADGKSVSEAVRRLLS